VDPSFGSLETAMFALLGLLMALTFSGAADRFDHRRSLIVEESNAIATAYLRIDLLPQAAQPQLRAEFRRYIETRMAYYHALTAPQEAMRLKSEAERLQREIWKQSVAAARELNLAAPMTLVVSALNTMIDITATRAMSQITHPPEVIFGLLALLALICAVFAGFSMAPTARPSVLHLGLFSAMLTVTVYVTMDLEYPRHGLIHLDAADELLLEVRRSMD
jgi:hypothetical protein